MLVYAESWENEEEKEEESKMVGNGASEAAAVDDACCLLANRYLYSPKHRFNKQSQSQAEDSKRRHGWITFENVPEAHQCNI
ncbi:hypothetical protein ACLKA7_010360 [Drosophila subpalustris]